MASPASDILERRSLTNLLEANFPAGSPTNMQCSITCKRYSDPRSVRTASRVQWAIEFAYIEGADASFRFCILIYYVSARFKSLPGVYFAILFESFHHVQINVAIDFLPLFIRRLAPAASFLYASSGSVDDDLPRPSPPRRQTSSLSRGPEQPKTMTAARSGWRHSPSFFPCWRSRRLLVRGERTITEEYATTVDEMFVVRMEERAWKPTTVREGSRITLEHRGLRRVGVPGQSLGIAKEKTCYVWRGKNTTAGQRSRQTTHLRQAKRVRFSVEMLPDFRMWESCRTMPQMNGLAREFPVSPALAFHDVGLDESLFREPASWRDHLREKTRVAFSRCATDDIAPIYSSDESFRITGTIREQLPPRDHNNITELMILDLKVGQARARGHKTCRKHIRTLLESVARERIHFFPSQGHSYRRGQHVSPEPKNAGHFYFVLGGQGRGIMEKGV
ncbi:hypothetical protein PR048_015143 [Dryococelus australis]|uniref:Uncharacterized protein n=1 Tax=Dryococelus australis TaxID=614101 RepID=A0ABQ9HGE1_9NEOP|nr:hypothetical protein PR048_015143 [Dryococelus australis]